MSFWVGIGQTVLSLATGAVGGVVIKIWADRDTEGRAHEKAHKEDLRHVCAAFVAEVTKLGRLRQMNRSMAESMLTVTDPVEGQALLMKRMAEFNQALDLQREAVELAFYEMFNIAPEDLIVCGRQLVYAAIARVAQDAVSQMSLPAAAEMPELPFGEYTQELYRFQNALREYLGHEALPPILTLQEALGEAGKSEALT